MDGCAVVKDGVFHLFYTMRSSREQGTQPAHRPRHQP